SSRPLPPPASPPFPYTTLFRSRDPNMRPNRAPSAPSTLRHEIESISQEVRRICEDLSPSALENVGLSAALQFALSHAVEHASLRSEEHTSELQSRGHLVCRLLL